MTLPASDKKIPGLDFLRAMAILLVFLWHYQRYGSPEWLKGISKFGWTGVDLFFVLSGYLIGTQLFSTTVKGEEVSIYQFYLKRFFRIVPAYLLVLILYFSFPGFREREGISPLWKFLTFTMNFGLDYQNAGSFSHAWSLCIEEQFYLFFPLLLVLFSKIKAGSKSLLIFPLLFAAGIAARIYSWQTFVAPLYADKENMGLVANAYSKYVYYPSYNRLDGLLVGVFIALLLAFRPAVKNKIDSKGNVFFVVSMLILAATYFLCTEPFSFYAAVFSYPLVSIAYGLLVLAALSPACFMNRLNFKIFNVLAMLSYSIYLTHKQINHVVQKLLAAYHFNETGMFAICFVVSIMGGLVLHLLIEKPFLKLRNKLLKPDNTLI